VAVASAGPYANLHLAQTHNHASIPLLSFLQAGCPSCRPTNSIKALEALYHDIILVLQQNRLQWYGHVLQKEDND